MKDAIIIQQEEIEKIEAQGRQNKVVNDIQETQVCTDKEELK